MPACVPRLDYSRPADDGSAAARARAYLAGVYPAGHFSAVSDREALRFFASRHIFYDSTAAGPVGDLAQQLHATMLRPPRYACEDGFFSSASGLLQRSGAARHAGLLPCVPGADCVRRQGAFMPRCAADLAARGRDVWFEVQHLAFDGRRVREGKRPDGWGAFLDHGPSGWWYILAPGSGVFYHAGNADAPHQPSSERRAWLQAHER